MLLEKLVLQEAQELLEQLDPLEALEQQEHQAQPEKSVPVGEQVSEEALELQEPLV